MSFILTEDMLAFTRIDGTRGTEPGRFQVWIALNSAVGVTDEFSL